VNALVEDWKAERPYLHAHAKGPSRTLTRTFNHKGYAGPVPISYLYGRGEGGGISSCITIDPINIRIILPGITFYRIYSFNIACIRLGRHDMRDFLPRPRKEGRNIATLRRHSGGPVRCNQSGA